MVTEVVQPERCDGGVTERLDTCGAAGTRDKNQLGVLTTLATLGFGT